MDPGAGQNLFDARGLSRSGKLILKGFGARLRQALEDSEVGSIRKFERALRAAKVSGVSRPAIYRYLNDDAVPSVDWAVAAAKALDVSPMWLIMGEGPPRPAVELATGGVYAPPEWVPPGARELWAVVLDRAGTALLEHSGQTPENVERLEGLAASVLGNVVKLATTLGQSDLSPLPRRRALIFELLALDALIPETAEDRLRAAAEREGPRAHSAPKRSKGRRPRKEKSR